uniref:Uncharacterized protein n=1 Tax=uncultured marine virus TaxID=186617 RepID=A0A0F7L8R3_9VIRU|nr:hypothetical protein [uncultured marine virus]
MSARWPVLILAPLGNIKVSPTIFPFEPEYISLALSIQSDKSVALRLITKALYLGCSMSYINHVIPVSVFPPPLAPPKRISLALLLRAISCLGCGFHLTSILFFLSW